MKILLPLPIILSLLLMNGERGKAQSISGVVATENKVALQFATVKLLSADTILQKSITTDKLGYYEFLALSPGKYFLQFHYIGYDSTWRTIAIDQSQIRQDTVFLKRSTNILNTVTISAEKPLIIQEVDKLVVNVEGTILSKGNNVLDLLRKSPGVSIDNSNKVMLNGKQGVEIQIDDRSSNLSTSDLLNLLSGMSSESIQSIEIISNPSSKYNASGSAGIINIVTKKAKLNGYSFGATLSSTMASKFRESLSLNLVKKHNEISYYSNISLNNSPSNISLSSSRLVPYDNLAYHTQTQSSSQYKSLFYRGGIDYQLSSSTVAGALIVANLGRGNSDFTTATLIDGLERPINYDFRTNTGNDSKNNGFGLNLYTESKLDTLGQKLTVNADFTKYSSSSQGNITNFGANLQELIRTASTNDINIKSIKLDYFLPLSKSTRIEAGLKSSIVETENEITFENYAGGIYSIDALKSNKFKLEENINAAYATLSKTFSPSFTAKIGIRMEQTYNNTKSVQTNREDKNDYLNIFPTIYLNKRFGKNSTLNFSYGRRINRPSYQDLNPFIFYNNPYSYYEGNPFLQPEISGNFTLGYSYLQKYFFSFNYMNSKGVIVATPVLDATKNIESLRPINFGNQDLFYFSMSFPLKIEKWWSTYTYINLYYNKLRSDYLNKEFNVTKPTAYIYQNHTFLVKKYTLELQFDYNASQSSGLYIIDGKFQSNFSVKRTFTKDNSLIGTIVFNDIFRSSATRSSYNYGDLIGKSSGYYDSQYIKVSLSYNLNKLSSKVNDNRERGNAEEQSRIKR